MLNLQNNNIEEVLKESGIIVADFSGNSMYPMLRSNRDRVVIEGVTRKLKKNDVPLYRAKNGKLVLHRIIKVTPEGYVIRGDNLYRNEYNVTDGDIAGVLKGFYRDAKLYECNTSKGYKLYVFYVRVSYPVRFVLYMVLSPVLSKIKALITGRKINK